MSGDNKYRSNSKHEPNPYEKQKSNSKNRSNSKSDGKKNSGNKSDSKQRSNSKSDKKTKVQKNKSNSKHRSHSKHDLKSDTKPENKINEHKKEAAKKPGGRKSIVYKASKEEAIRLIDESKNKHKEEKKNTEPNITNKEEKNISKSIEKNPAEEKIDNVEDDFIKETEAVPELIPEDEPECNNKENRNNVIEKDDKNSNNTGENTKVTLEDGKTLPNAIQSEAQAKAKSDKYSTTYDTATLNSAIGMIDMKLLCKCFAYAIHKHIMFSKGKTMLYELGKSNNEEPQDFAYNLSNTLKVHIPNKDAGNNSKIEENKIPNEEIKENKLSVDKCKQLISESFSNLTGQYIPPEQLHSYLTLEGGEEEVDMNYTQNKLEDFIKTSIVYLYYSGWKRYGLKFLGRKL